MLDFNQLAKVKLPVIWRWRLVNQGPSGSNAIGAMAAEEDPDGNGTTVRFDLRFPGQQYDASTGRHYNYFRDYEAQTGRYVESDSIGLLGGMTTYSYGDSNPLLLSDSLGLASEDQRADCCGKTPRAENIRKKGFGGFVACCGGQQFACTVVPDDYSAEGKKVIGDCFEAHEIEHTKDPLVSCNCSNPLPHAAGTEYGMGVQAECSAYRVSLGCLEKKNICRKRNDQCRRELKKMIMDHLEFGRACAW